jgi:iron complex transport system permease protein
MSGLEYSIKENFIIGASPQIKERSARAFRSKKDERNYWALLTTLVALGVLSTYGLLVYNNPVPIDSPSFIPVVRRRMVAIVSMVIAAICQSLSTVAFQSITNNKVITPSLLGFEALYTTINTSTLFFFGAGTFINFTGIGSFVFQVAVMILMCLILYGWLLSGKYGNLQLMLLVGVIIGTGLRSISSFMRRVLTPSEFDILQARLFGSVNNANSEYFVVAIPMVMVAALLLLTFSKKLNVLSLGKDVSVALGVKHQISTIYTLVLVSILMSISTALVGPLTFYGFLVATLSYQAAQTYDHRYVFPMALSIGFLILTGAYFLMYHVLSAFGYVSIIIELFGGLTFLFIILRKGTL